MNKFWIIFKTEYAQVVKKKSFIIGIILTPVMMAMFTLVPALLANRKISESESYAVLDADGRGIGERFVTALEKYRLDDDSTVNAYLLRDLYEIESADQSGITELRRELDSLVLTKQLKNYVAIYPRVEETDSVLMVAKSMSFRTAGRFDRTISDILSAMRLENSNVNLGVDSVLTMARRIDMIQESPGGKSRDFLSIYLGGLMFVMILFATVIGFGQILMRSVLEEKNSRVMEVLISSVSPFQLMMGKICGLGAANLTQVAIWLVMGSILFFNRTSLQIPEQVGAIAFNPVFIGFFVVFLFLAYVMYSTIFAFIGSICSTDKETQNFIFPITMSLMLPLIIGMYIVQEPDSILTVALSMIPILTPSMMVLRLSVIGPESFTFADPIIVEAVLGVIIASLFSLAVIWITSRVFRVGILMTGKRATLPEIMKWIRHS
ncbi:MAG: ABC transporter permease [FCB group bacterium]|nr:ABC transporter permease [FCB group bacterium]